MTDKGLCNNALSIVVSGSGVLKITLPETRIEFLI